MGHSTLPRARYDDAMATRDIPVLWRGLFAVATAAAVGHLVADERGMALWATVLKPIPVLALFGWVLEAPTSALRFPVALGLLASAAGDVLLERPGGFLAGLAAFLFAHLAYLTGFWRAAPRLALQRAAPFVLFGAAMGLWIAPGAGPVQLPVGLYVLAICTMMWRASALAGAPGLPVAVGRLAFAGSLAFAASDSLLAVNRFVQPLAWANLPIMLLYWLGQVGIAAAAVGAGRAGRSAS